MKKIILLLLTSFFFLTTVDAQTHVKDSLKLLLQKEKTDTGRVLLLADLGYEYIGSKSDTIMVLALEGLALSRRIGFVKGEAVSLNRIGGSFITLGNYPKAMESLLQALKITSQLLPCTRTDSSQLPLEVLQGFSGGQQVMLNAGKERPLSMNIWDLVPRLLSGWLLPMDRRQQRKKSRHGRQRLWPTLTRIASQSQR